MQHAYSNTAPNINHPTTGGAIGTGITKITPLLNGISFRCTSLQEIHILIIIIANLVAMRFFAAELTNIHMLSKDYVRALTAALLGLGTLVLLLLIMTFALFFLWPADNGTATASAPAGGSGAPAAAPKAVALTAEQEHGKTLFSNNCAQCHAVTDEVVVGPGLKGVRQRTQVDAWLAKWIKYSQAVVASGDAYAVGVYNKYGKIAMSAFPQFSDQDINDILNYIDSAGK